MNFKAAVLEKIKKPLKIKKIIMPEIKKHQVLVKLKYSGICKSQLMEIDGHRENKKFIPHMLGHEGCGTVIKIGKGVKKVKKGDKVILSWIKSSGSSSKGGSIKCGKSNVSYGPITTFSDYSIVSENKIVKKPSYINWKIATLFGCALSTGAGIVIKQCRIRKNMIAAVK